MGEMARYDRATALGTTDDGERSEQVRGARERALRTNGRRRTFTSQFIKCAGRSFGPLCPSLPTGTRQEWADRQQQQTKNRPTKQQRTATAMNNAKPNSAVRAGSYATREKETKAVLFAAMVAFTKMQ